MPSEAEPRRENLRELEGDKFLLAIPPRAAPRVDVCSKENSHADTIGAGKAGSLILRVKGSEPTAAKKKPRTGGAGLL